jgi:hypothetical protein
VSKIESSMHPDLRDVMLSEVRSLLPAFLSAAAVERSGPVNASLELLRLPESDLRRVLAVHAMLAAQVRAFVSALPLGIRRPITSSTRPRVAGRTVTSGIDWAATVRHRATASPVGGIWVTRPANRIFDTPENRALAWVLQTLEERSLIAVPHATESPGAWGEEIRSMTGSIRRSRQTAWLEAIPTTWPGDDVYLRLKADRMGFYHTNVSDAARYLRRIIGSPTPGDIVDALCELYFEPTQDWRLFEIAVLMRICRSLTTVGERIGATRLFIDGRIRPFARYRINSIREVRIWYQAWPPETAPSALDDAVRYYELPSGGNRPDIVIELVETGISRRAFILELKASASAPYMSGGLSQLLGYLRDRPRLVSRPGSGWLIAPTAGSFVSKPPEHRALWVTSCDEVAAAVLRACTG